MAAADFVPGNEVISVNFLTRRFRLRDQNKERSQLLRQGYVCFFIKPLEWFYFILDILRTDVWSHSTSGSIVLPNYSRVYRLKLETVSETNKTTAPPCNDK